MPGNPYGMGSNNNNRYWTLPTTLTLACQSFDSTYVHTYIRTHTQNPLLPISLYPAGQVHGAGSHGIPSLVTVPGCNAHNGARRCGGQWSPLFRRRCRRCRVDLILAPGCCCYRHERFFVCYRAITKCSWARQLSMPGDAATIQHTTPKPIPHMVFYPHRPILAPPSLSSRPPSLFCYNSRFLLPHRQSSPSQPRGLS